MRARRRRSDALRSREAVLDAAIDMLGTKPGARMDEIAQAAGVARQTVYAHFASRQALLAAAVERLVEHVSAALDGLDVDSGTATSALARWAEASWALIERYPLLLSPELAEAAGPGDEVERHEPITGGLLRILRRGQVSGEFDRHVPVGWLVAAVIALGHAAGQEVSAGRMAVTDAGVVFRDSAQRVCRPT